MGNVSYIEIDTSRNKVRKTLGRIGRSKFVQNLKHQVEENPVLVIMAAASIIGVTAKLINAAGHARGSHAYAKQVNYRITKGR